MSVEQVADGDATKKKSGVLLLPSALAKLVHGPFRSYRPPCKNWHSIGYCQQHGEMVTPFALIVFFLHLQFLHKKLEGMIARQGKASTSTH
jgi:hypothetical protein